MLLYLSLSDCDGADTNGQEARKTGDQHGIYCSIVMYFNRKILKYTWCREKFIRFAPDKVAQEICPRRNLS